MKTLSSIFLASALLAAPSSAATIDVSPVNSSSVFADENGQNKWYVATSIMVGARSFNNVAAGVFRVEGTDENNVISQFLAFCLQPLEHLTLPKTHTINDPFAPDVSASLQALASNAWDLVTDRVSAGAFQMAAWEIVSENGAYDVHSGNFKVTSNRTRSNQAEATAQSWLDNIADNTWVASGNGFQILTAAGTQDLLTNVENPAPVPLPASGLLLLAGLGGAGAVAAKRRKR